mgnify:CR=1 FL=1
MSNIRVKKRNGRLENFEVNKINRFVERACENLSGVSASEVVLDMETTFYDKISTSQIDKSKKENIKRAKLFICSWQSGTEHFI